MPDFELSTHAKNMMIERKIVEDWVWRTVDTPSKKKTDADGNVHYIKPIRERQGRVLHIIVNPNVSPYRIITLFFDRRLGESK